MKRSLIWAINILYIMPISSTTSNLSQRRANTEKKKEKYGGWVNILFCFGFKYLWHFRVQFVSLMPLWALQITKGAKKLVFNYFSCLEVFSGAEDGSLFPRRRETFPTSPSHPGDGETSPNAQGCFLTFPGNSQASGMARGRPPVPKMARNGDRDRGQWTCPRVSLCVVY